MDQRKLLRRNILRRIREIWADYPDMRYSDLCLRLWQAYVNYDEIPEIQAINIEDNKFANFLENFVGFGAQEGSFIAKDKSSRFTSAHSSEVKSVHSIRDA